MKSFEYTITDPVGIHARPAGMLAKKAKEFPCEITVSLGDKSASATRLMAVMGLCIKRGDTVTVTCSGEDEETACAKMKEWFSQNL